MAGFVQNDSRHRCSNESVMRRQGERDAFSQLGAVSQRQTVTDQKLPYSLFLQKQQPTTKPYFLKISLVSHSFSNRLSVAALACGPRRRRRRL